MESILCNRSNHLLDDPASDTNHPPRDAIFGAIEQKQSTKEDETSCKSTIVGPSIAKR